MNKVQGSSLIDGTYRKIAQELESSNYSIGTKLQPIRSLAKKFNVSYLTAQKAIKALQLQGALEAKPGDGLYVVGKPKPLEESVLEFINKKDISRPKNGCRASDTFSVGVVMPFWLSSRGSGAIYEIVKGIVSESDKFHWPIELIHNSGNESELPAFVDKVHRRNFNGIAWLQPPPWHKMNLMRLIDRGYDVVVTGRKFKDIPAEYVQFDHKDMAKKIADFFFDEVNAKKICVFTGPIDGFIVDPYSVDIVDALREEFKKRGRELPYENICQAFLSQRHDLIVEDFIKKNLDLDGIICLHELLTPDIENMDRLNILNRKNKIPLIDVSGIFNVSSHQMEHIEIIGLQWPLENIGKTVIRKFEDKWLRENKTSSDKIDLSVNLIR